MTKREETEQLIIYLRSKYAHNHVTDYLEAHKDTIDFPLNTSDIQWLSAADEVKDNALFALDTTDTVGYLHEYLGRDLANKFIDYTIKSASELTVHQKLAGLKHFQTWLQDNLSDIIKSKGDPKELKELFRKAYHDGMVTGGKAYAICKDEETSNTLRNTLTDEVTK